MDQNTIIEALQKALAKGSGDLDDLNNLLARAQADIVRAKEEQKKQKAEAEKKRGEDIAALANRLLNNATTAADCAYVLNTWRKINNVGGMDFTEDDINSVAEISKHAKDFEDAIVELAETILEKPAEQTKSKSKCKVTIEQPKTESADDIIDKFLKSFGLR